MTMMMMMVTMTSMMKTMAIMMKLQLYCNNNKNNTDDKDDDDDETDDQNNGNDDDSDDDDDANDNDNNNNNVITLKAAVLDSLQSTHCFATCSQYVYSPGNNTRHDHHAQHNSAMWCRETAQLSVDIETVSSSSAVFDVMVALTRSSLP